MDIFAYTAEDSKCTIWALIFGIFIFNTLPEKILGDGNFCRKFTS